MMRHCITIQHRGVLTMQEYVCKVVDKDGSTLRRFVAFARSRGGALRRAYEVAAEIAAARDVIVIAI
jgi:hypothetical protein